MNADAWAGLTVRACLGFSATLPLQLAIERLAASVVLAAVSAALRVIPVRRTAAVGRRQA